MKFLDRFVRLILLLCMVVLGCYIIFRSVTIAGENGFFKNTPGLSVVYEKIEEWASDTFMPVLSYAIREEESSGIVEKMLEDTYAVIYYGLSQKNQERMIESQSEYDLILKAEARAEENKRPQDMESWIKKHIQKKEETTEEKETEETKVEQESFEDLLYQYFSMDATTTIDEERLNASLLTYDMTMEKKNVPQMLIYHTHSQEGFVDSVEGDDTTSIVGVGDYLTEILTEQYGYQVIHDRGVYDLVDGVLDRNVAYDYSGVAVEKILEENPEIEIVIDLHRDGVDGTKFVTEYQGKPAAKLMMIVGMSRTADNVDISYLPNPYIEENLAFALQIEKQAEKDFPGLMRNIYLMAYRFNMHYRPKSLLLEAGTQLNTLEEEKNAMEAFAKLLDEVLQG
ncbi:MAG: stage II sporulation protein P [Muricoprocola sp.]